MTMHLLAVQMLCLSALLRCGVSGSVGPPCQSLVPADNSAFEYLGAWHTNGTGCLSIYPGSQVRFALRGQGRLRLRSGMADTIHAAITRNGSIVWSGLLDRSEVSIDGGSSNTPFTVLYVMTSKKGFNSSSPEAKGAELEFLGVELASDASISPYPAKRSGLLLDIIGDSITAGTSILGRSGTWMDNSDATLTYAFLLADTLEAQYRIRAFPGIGCIAIADRFPFFREGVHFPTSQVPDIVFVNIAANDREKPVHAYRSGMRNLLETIFRTYPATHVVLLNFCRMTPNRLPVLEELSASYPEGKVSCFDARPYLVGYSDTGVHPDVESHRRLADALALFVRSNLLTRIRSHPSAFSRDPPSMYGQAKEPK